MIKNILALQIPSLIAKPKENFKNLDVFLSELFSDKKCLVYERNDGKEQVIVSVNLGTNIFDIKFDGKLFDYFNGTEYKSRYTIPANSCTILTNFRRDAKYNA